jgi:hypothetical protein
MHGALCVNLWLLVSAEMTCQSIAKKLIVSLGTFAIGVAVTTFVPRPATKHTDDRLRHLTIAPLATRAPKCFNRYSKRLKGLNLSDINKKILEIREELSKLTEGTSLSSPDAKRSRESRIEELEILLEAWEIEHEAMLTAYSDGTTKLVLRETCYEN